MGIAGKNVLVTGGTGFIGSHLVNSLVNKNARVIVPYQNLNPKSYFFQKNLDKETILVSCDLKNYKRVFDIVTKFEIDYIFHLAAQPIVTIALHSPLETLETNVMGSVNILEAARLYKNVQRIIVTSSDKAYGKISKAIETAPLKGDHPYEVSKSAADLITSAYFKTYKLPVIITRFGNVYGEGDLNFSRIVPSILRAAIKNEELIVRSDGKFVRDYVYVEDIVDALISLLGASKKNLGEAFNVSSKENLSVLELIKLTEKILNKRIKYRISFHAINEIPKQSVNFDKLRKVLGWNPKQKLSTSIPIIYQWYSSYFGQSFKID